MPDRETITDETLMARLAAGDSGAFETLLRRHADRVHRFANTMLRDAAAADDAVQQTFLRLLQNAASWKPTGPLPAYLLRITRNLCLNEITRRRPREHADLDPASEDHDPARIAEDREEAGRVRAALDALAPRDREILWLRVYEKLSYREISEITGIQEDSARSRMRYALNALSALLGKKRGKS